MLSLIEARLDDSKEYLLVESALDLSLLKKGNIPRERCAYPLLLGSEPKSTMQDSAAINQERRAKYAVLIGIQSRNDSKGTKGNSKLEALLKITEELLNGWVPTGSIDPLVMGKSRLFTMADNGIWWLMEFELLSHHETIIHSK